MNRQEIQEIQLKWTGFLCACVCVWRGRERERERDL